MSSSPIVSRPLYQDVGRGLIASPILRATVLSGVITGLVYAAFVAPAPWIVAAFAAGSFALGLIAQLPERGHLKTLMEPGAIEKLLWFPKYNRVVDLPGDRKIILGALPNRVAHWGERLKHDEGVGAVLSVNESWERTPIGLSCPYTGSDWEQLGVSYAEINAPDYTNLDNAQLNRAADQIKSWIDDGKDVYVHCRAGMGRSAMAIAAYLIKYQGYEVGRACDEIKTNRPVCVLDQQKKRDALSAFARTLS